MVLTKNDSIGSSNAELTVQHILTHELYGVPLSLFHENGMMRLAKNKSKMKNKLNVDIT